MSRFYSQTTIKKLFGPGTPCSFPNCFEYMIDENDIIIGEICHIKGENETSARYNSNMTEKQRTSYGNLILLCPTHHTLIDKDLVTYTKEGLKKMKSDHKNKTLGKKYTINDDMLRIISISINDDEYSLVRIHNFLKLYKKLRGNETKELWYEYFAYALKWLKVSSPISQKEKEAIRIVFNDILEFKSNDVIFQNLLLAYLDKIPGEIRNDCIEEIKPYIKTIVEKDFKNVNLPRLYKYLNHPEIETLNYLIDNAGNFDIQQFDNVLSNMIDFKAVAKKKKLFLDFEQRLWKKLDEAEKKKEENKSLYENIKTLINKFINITL
jgi:hypothetical protein